MPARSNLVFILGLPLLLAGSGCHSAPAAPAPAPVVLGDVAPFGATIAAVTPDSITVRLTRPAHVIVLRVWDDGVEPIVPRRGADEDRFVAGSHVVSLEPLMPFASVTPPPRLSTYLDPGGTLTGSCGAGYLAAQAQARQNVPHDSTAARASAPGAEATYARCVANEAAQAPPPTAAPAGIRARGARYWLIIVSDAAMPLSQLDARLRVASLPDGDPDAMARALPAALVGGRDARWGAYVVPMPAR